MLWKRYQISLLVGLGLALSGCGGGEGPSGEETPATARIVAYASATYTAAPLAETSNAPTGTAALPTPTPFVYTVVENDNLTWIAERFNITLDQLIAANPGIDPSFLSVGTELIIPPGDGGVGGILPTPTPLSVRTHTPVCYSTSAGGLWCFFLIENSLDTALENLAGVVTLTASNGDLVATMETAALLNRVASGASIPLAAYFDAPVPDWEHVSGQVISAIAVPQDDDRYLIVEASEVEIDIDEDGSSASVKGALQLGADSPPAGTLWVVAVAYDENGLPVGLRRWESTVRLEAGDSAPFAIDIYSVGRGIARVELLVEARPVNPSG